MTEPTTAAGRALGVAYRSGLTDLPLQIDQRIAAIEAEARATAEARTAKLEAQLRWWADNHEQDDPHAAANTRALLEGTE